MDNSLKKNRNHSREGLTPPPKGNPQTLLIGKRLKKKTYCKLRRNKGQRQVAEKALTTPFHHKQPSPSDRPAAVQGAKLGYFTR